MSNPVLFWLNSKKAVSQILLRSNTTRLTIQKHFINTCLIVVSCVGIGKKYSMIIGNIINAMQDKSNGMKATTSVNFK